jgi:hypothetical protein
MSYLRSKVNDVKAAPAPGKFPAPLTVYLVCETPNVQIMYTMDGTEPIANSLRSHGFQSAVYSDISGIPLKGGGVHTITAVAIKEGYVPSKVKRFQYVLEGDPLPPKARPLGDVIIERRFLAMTSLDPPMPLRLARARTPHLTCALVDTCPRDVLREKRKAGEELALFELTHNTRAVSRQDTYRRIVAPSMSLALPQLPNKTPEFPVASLRSTMSSRFALTRYEHPDFGSSIGRSTLSRRQQLVVGPLGVKQRFNYHPPRTAGPVVTEHQLNWFEARTGLTPNPDEDFDDPAEKEATQRELDRSAASIKAELDRKVRSPAFARAAAAAHVSVSDDIAKDSKTLVNLIFHAKEFCHTQLSRMLCCVSYSLLAQRLGKSTSFGAAELANASEGSLTVAEAQRSLSRLPEVGPKQYDTKTFLLLARYCVWSARPIPEAIFGLAFQYWRAQSAAAGGSEVRITRLEATLVADTYQRTRGCHEASASQLQEKVQKLPWGVDESDGKVPYGVFLSVLSQNFPIIDSALVEMGNLAHNMYMEPLSTWGQVHHG